MSDNDQRAGEGRTILVVEDNLHNRRIFTGVLTHYGFEVLEALNGEEAVDLAKRNKPDLILMDLSLPVMDGWEATTQIKGEPDLAQIPVVALTAHAMTGDEERALEVGCDGYLAKPISPKQLVAEVLKYLEST